MPFLLSKNEINSIFIYWTSFGLRYCNHRITRSLPVLILYDFNCKGWWRVVYCFHFICSLAHIFSNILFSALSCTFLAKPFPPIASSTSYTYAFTFKGTLEEEKKSEVQKANRKGRQVDLFCFGGRRKGRDSICEYMMPLSSLLALLFNHHVRCQILFLTTATFSYLEKVLWMQKEINRHKGRGRASMQKHKWVGSEICELGLLKSL